MNAKKDIFINQIAMTALRFRQDDVIFYTLCANSYSLIKMWRYHNLANANYTCMGTYLFYQLSPHISRDRLKKSRNNKNILTSEKKRLSILLQKMHQNKRNGCLPSSIDGKIRCPIIVNDNVPPFSVMGCFVACSNSSGSIVVAHKVQNGARILNTLPVEAICTSDVNGPLNMSLRVAEITSTVKKQIRLTALGVACPYLSGEFIAGYGFDSVFEIFGFRDASM